MLIYDHNMERMLTGCTGRESDLTRSLNSILNHMSLYYILQYLPPFITSLYLWVEKMR